MKLSFGYFWGLVNAIQYSAALPRPVRRILLRSFGISIGKFGYIAENVYLGSSKISISTGGGIAAGSFIDSSAKVEIGEWARIGPCVKVLTSSHRYRDSVFRRGLPSPDLDFSAPVQIERGCWIGAGSIILPGVVIREGCVIAAGSVVTESTEPNGLYAGTPSRRIKTLPLDDDNQS